MISDPKHPESASANRLEVICKISIVICLVVALGRQGEAYRTGGEVVQFPPNQRRKVQPVVRAVQVKALRVDAVFEGDIKTAGHSDQKLMAALWSMTGPFGSPRHIIKVKNALKDKREVAS